MKPALNTFSLRFVLLALMALGCACEEVVPTTQIVVVVDAEPELRDTVHSVNLNTLHGSETLSREDGLTLPFTFSLVPNDEAFMGDLEIEALDASGVEIVSRRVQLAFRSRRTLSYGVLLSRSCAETEADCGKERTCDGCVGCVPREVPAEDLIPLRHASQAIATWQRALACEDEADASTPGP